MKQLLTILLLIAAIIPCSAKKAAIKREQTSSLDLPSGSRLGKAKMGAYLMVYHKDCDHSLHNFGFVETTDFRTFTPIGHFDEQGSPMRRTNFAEQKHGAVIQITKKEAKRMEKFWNSIK